MRAGSPLLILLLGCGRGGIEVTDPDRLLNRFERADLEASVAEFLSAAGVEDLKLNEVRVVPDGSIVGAHARGAYSKGRRLILLTEEGATLNAGPGGALWHELCHALDSTKDISEQHPERFDPTTANEPILDQYPADADLTRELFAHWCELGPHDALAVRVAEACGVEAGGKDDYQQRLWLSEHVFLGVEPGDTVTGVDFIELAEWPAPETAEGYSRLGDPARYGDGLLFVGSEATGGPRLFTHVTPTAATRLSLPEDVGGLIPAVGGAVILLAARDPRWIRLEPDGTMTEQRWCKDCEISDRTLQIDPEHNLLLDERGVVVVRWDTGKVVHMLRNEGVEANPSSYLLGELNGEPLIMDGATALVLRDGALVELPMPVDAEPIGLGGHGEGVLSLRSAWPFEPMPLVLNVQDPLGAVQAGILTCDGSADSIDSIHDIDGHAVLADWRSQKVSMVPP
ncbi:hypothetical protein L6R49_02595 [Myxococcota bacterium]|nr:hypothetical protein [Myxococcota bacterium]